MKTNNIKKILAVMLAFTLMISGVMFQPFSKEVQASATTVGDCYVERLNMTSNVPTPANVTNSDDWVFAGWYTDASCGTAVSSGVTEGRFFAKFVPASVLTVKCQLSNEPFTEDSKQYYALRMVTSVDSLRYKNVGFMIQVDNEEVIDYPMDTVCKFIQAAENTAEFNTYYPTIFHDVSTRFATANMKIEATEEALGKSITIVPYWTTLDGTKVEGTTRRIIPSDDSKNPEGVTREDTSWYVEGETTFTINNAAELYGFASLVNNGTLANKSNVTVKLGKDILVNAGSASDWSATVKPLNEWTPIGNTTENAFAGTFDGQGHAISGIYCLNSGNVNGFLGYTTGDCKIKNFGLLNSYFGSTAYNTLYMGSIIGHGGGVVDTVRSNAICYTTPKEAGTNVNDAQYVGGLVGYINSSTQNNLITNCKYEGSISTTSRHIGGVVGAVHADTSNAVSLGIRHCLNSGIEIASTATSNTAYRIGGLCGFVYGQSAEVNLTVEDSINISRITMAAAQNSSNINRMGAVVGAIAGTNSVAINNSYATVGTWASAVDTTATSVVATEMVDDSSVTIDCNQLLVATEGINAKPLDFRTYWKVTDSTPILRNFDSDIRWFNEREENKTEFTLTTAAQLYGLAELTNAGEFNDASKEYVVKLGADITVNEGDAYKWPSSAPNTWTPIGNSTTNTFAASFDGQGHTISGVYCKGTSCVGLFGFLTKDSIIKDFRLENSYFYADGGTSGACVGSIAARNGGVIEKVYSNAKIDVVGINTKDNQVVGGIIGLVETDAVGGSPNRISNCWFAGTIVSSMRATGGIVGAARNNLSSTESMYLVIEHCYNTGNINCAWTYDTTFRVGGMIGFSYGQLGTVDLTINDCLNIGQMKSNCSGLYVGSVTGRLNDKSSVEITDTYATTESCSKSHDKTSAKFLENGETVNQITETSIIGEDVLSDVSGLNTEYWQALNNTTPVLKSFYTQQ